MQYPRAGSARRQQKCFQGEKFMADNERVWPSGLTLSEAEELHRHIIEGTRIFFFISAIAHLLAYIYTPWLK
jgi:light-harvesting protein B-800-850 beta chain